MTPYEIAGNLFRTGQLPSGKEDQASQRQAGENVFNFEF
jgi:hypothetical protein